MDTEKYGWHSRLTLWRQSASNLTLDRSSSYPLRDIGWCDSSICYRHCLLTLPVSTLSSVLGDPLKMSVAVLSVVLLLVFSWFLEANSELHLQAYFLASSTHGQLVVQSQSGSSHYSWRVVQPCCFYSLMLVMWSCHVSPKIFQMQRWWNIRGCYGCGP